MQRLFLLEAQYKERVWGGQRLRAQQPPIGEAWIAYGQSRVASGEAQGRTLEELMRLDGPALLGRAVAARFPEEFPLLVKLLDVAEWLSVQVHPDDAAARRLVGPGAHGKTEAWHILDAEPGAQLLAGVKPGVDERRLAQAIRAGAVLEVAESFTVRAGDSIFIPAGILHALGPGLFLYEVQQQSDTTYRVYDWDRPKSAGRALHVEESVAVADPTLHGRPTHLPDLSGGEAELVKNAYFVLERLTGDQTGDTGGERFHLLTCIGGQAEVDVNGETQTLQQDQTLLVAGAAGRYNLRAEGASLLRASVPT